MKRRTELAPAGDQTRRGTPRVAKWVVLAGTIALIQWPQALPVILLALYWISLAMLNRSRDAAAWTQAPIFLRGRWLWCLVCVLLLAQGVWLTVAFDDLIRSEMRQAGASAAPSAPRVVPSTQFVDDLSAVLSRPAADPSAPRVVPSTRSRVRSAPRLSFPNAPRVLPSTPTPARRN